MYVIGLMSGTSADGIDAALAQFDGDVAHLRWRLVAHAHSAFDQAMRDAILAACNPGTGSSASVYRLNFALGEAFAPAPQRLT